MSAPNAPAAREGFHEGIVLGGNNPISQYVNSRTMTIVNITEPTHVFYPGRVTIQVVAAPGSTSDIEITGTGNGNDPFINDVTGFAFFELYSANGVAQYCAAKSGFGTPPTP